MWGTSIWCLLLCRCNIYIWKWRSGSSWLSHITSGVLRAGWWCLSTPVGAQHKQMHPFSILHLHKSLPQTHCQTSLRSLRQADSSLIVSSLLCLTPSRTRVPAPLSVLLSQLFHVKLSLCKLIIEYFLASWVLLTCWSGGWVGQPVACSYWAQLLWTQQGSTCLH